MTGRLLSQSNHLTKISVSRTFYLSNNHKYSNRCRRLTKDIITRCPGRRTRGAVSPIVRAGLKDLIHLRLQTSIIFSNTIRTIVTISIKVRKYYSKGYRKYQQHKVDSNSNNKCSQHSYIKHRSETLEWAATSLHHLNSFHHAVTIDNIKQLLTHLNNVSHFNYSKWTSNIITLIMQGILIHMNKHFIKKCHHRSKTVHLDPKSNVLSKTIARMFLKRKINHNKRIDLSKRGNRDRNLSLNLRLKWIFPRLKTRQAHVPLKIYLEVD